MSGLNRITGVAFSGALYLSAMAFCLHPLVPAIDSAHLVEFIHGGSEVGMSRETH